MTTTTTTNQAPAYITEAELEALEDITRRGGAPTVKLDRGLLDSLVAEVRAARERGPAITLDTAEYGSLRFAAQVIPGWADQLAAHGYKALATMAREQATTVRTVAGRWHLARALAEGAAHERTCSFCQDGGQ